VTSLPADANELYVVERGGTVRVIRNGKKLPEPFLDISDVVLTEYVERGLLGLAFHPDYADNGRFFVYYVSVETEDTKEGSIVLAEYRRERSSPPRASSEAEQVLIKLQQPSQFHKAGMLMFDRNGYLFAATGNGGFDGASAELNSLLGKLLRLDVDAEEKPYGIPRGNMQGYAVLPEIWSYGLRNPWRFSIDHCTGDLYVGDVGDKDREEVSVEIGGRGNRHYGYPIVEGDICRLPYKFGCKVRGFTKPIATYSHSEGRCAVVGGFVYRGHAIPGLLGTYLYADFCTGRIWALEQEPALARPDFDGAGDLGEGSMNVGPLRDDPEFSLVGLQSGVINAREITEDLNPDRITQLASFGQDARGELYVTSISRGTVYRIEPE
jgi:glucose/arabinose dehydrogenase